MKKGDLVRVIGGSRQLQGIGMSEEEARSIYNSIRTIVKIVKEAYLGYDKYYLTKDLWVLRGYIEPERDAI